MATPLPTGVYLRPGSSVFQIRIGVPKGLENFYRDPKTGKPKADAYRASLRTSSRDEAITKALKLIAEHRDRFDALRAKAAPAPFVTLTPALAQQFAEAVRFALLNVDDHATFIEADPAARVEARARLDRARAGAIAAMRNGDLSAARAAAERTAAVWGLRIDWDSQEGARCLIQITRAVVAALVDVEKRQEGAPIVTPDAPEPPVVQAEPPEPAKPPVTLRDVVPSWIARNAPKDNAVGRTQKALALFEQAVGSVPLSELTKAKGAAFVEFLLDPARGWSRKTAGNHAACITALANAAVKADLLERNPLDLAFDKTIGAKSREPWTDDELRRMYGHPLFSDRMDEVPHWQDVAPPDGRALLLLLLHTGARIGEIAQLRKEDFQTRNGITAIRITAEAGTVKTQESERVVPLAAHLLAGPWFAQWLEGVLGGTGPAFPSACGRARGPGDTMGQWFRQFRNDAALPQGALEGSHKFRHWLRSALAEKHVGEATMDSITGHSAQGSAGRKTYTAAAALPTMLEALDRIDWPSVSQ
ncbi:tyrosine-type recombinase/integrase [Burkholderia diffusa]|uniref:tyrosine-type recombinase/integrase n=1 Tax=Burkholderia diffusa TaxID=488732 RepID=UPI002AAF1E46|nr:tyrosine-type recombinase/integrase [Burkholderia diffusa]